MSTVDKESSISILRDWQDRRLAAYGESPTFSRTGPADVTVLCYFYRPDDQVAAKFKYSQCAIYETWRHCGLMKTVIVTNRESDVIKSFRLKFPDWVSVQTEPSLVPGDLDCMSIDCNARLGSRFNTPYVLIVQDDGFPLRPGLERFLGKCDFIGSPFRRRTLPGRIASIVFRHCPANGGFSLRTKRICQAANKLWRLRFSNRDFGPEMVDDIFYTDTLPRTSFRYRLLMKMASPAVGADFCYDHCLPDNITPTPFGFHSARAFERLTSIGAVERP